MNIDSLSPQKVAGGPRALLWLADREPKQNATVDDSTAGAFDHLLPQIMLLANIKSGNLELVDTSGLEMLGGPEVTGVALVS